jgi:ATP-dependent RNA helicase RhlE
LPRHAERAAPTSAAAFRELGLSDAACATLARLGYAQPTPIQIRTIPPLLAGRDVLARAQTGTGKTAAFALPMIERLRAADSPAPRGPRGLVLVPTRELAVQVERAIARYGAGTRLRTAVLVGGVSMGPQVQALAGRPDIVVATPGRLLDHVQRRTVSLQSIEILTLDEADRMLDVGFLPALRRLIAVMPRARQTLLFSATLPQDVLALAAEMTRDAQHVAVADAVVSATVTHQVHPVSDQNKPDVLAHLLGETPSAQALVFCKTKRGSDRVGRRLEQSGVRVAVIHGNKSQSARTRVLDAFRAGRVRVLVATDIAARGLDIAQLPLVVNYDLPLVAEDYVHRIGRTGRAGVAGRAVSLVAPADRGLLRAIERVVRSEIQHIGGGGGGGHDVSTTVAVAERHHPPARPQQQRRRRFRSRAR